jgi:hypothetical protein
MANHHVIGIRRIQIIPRHIPDVIFAALDDRPTFSEIIGQAIYRMAVEGESVGEYRQRFDPVVIDVENKIRLRLRRDALGRTQTGLEFQFPEPIRAGQRKSKSQAAAYDSLLPRAVFKLNEFAQRVNELLFQHAAEESVGTDRFERLLGQTLFAGFYQLA